MIPAPTNHSGSPALTRDDEPTCWECGEPCSPNDFITALDAYICAPCIEETLACN